MRQRLIYLGEREQNMTEDESGEDFNLLLIDGVTGRNGTSVGTSHLISRSTKSRKIFRYQTGVVKHVRLMQD